MKVGVNPYFIGKLAKDAPRSVWSAFNGAFENADLTIEGIADHIRQGHALTAVCRGYRKTENFIQRQDLGLDFDTNDQRSAIETLISDPFIAQYAGIVHTTSSHTPEAPRARVLFVIDKPITDQVIYAEYAQALIWRFGSTDDRCKEAVRVWFGAQGCDLRILDNTLPCVILDKLVTQWRAATQETLSADNNTERAPYMADASGTATELLDQALKVARFGNRNNTGFWLACQLRNNGIDIDQAREVMLDYQSAVEKLGKPFYLAREATDSLFQAYKRQPRIDKTIGALEAAVEAREIEISANVRKTLTGILDIARKAGRTTKLNLSLREVERACYGFVSKTSVKNHIDDLCAIGVLKLVKRSNRRHANLYNLICVKVGHSQQEKHTSTAIDCPSLTHIKTAQNYRELQASELCAIGAKVHPELAKNDDESRHSFGSSAQAIMSVLAALPDNGWLESIDTLCNLTGISRRTAERKIAFLEYHCIIETDRHGTRKVLRLSDNWYENLVGLVPSLTSFGQDVLRAQQAAKQQIRQQEYITRLTTDEKVIEEAQRITENAKRRLELADATLATAQAKRRAWMDTNGMKGADMPAISLHPRSNPKAAEKVIHVNGRDLTPGESAITKPNGKNAAELAELAEKWPAPQEKTPTPTPAPEPAPVDNSRFVTNLPAFLDAIKPSKGGTLTPEQTKLAKWLDGKAHLTGDQLHHLAYAIGGPIIHSFDYDGIRANLQ